MQRYPSKTRKYRETSGEVPQWLVDTCNEDNDYDEEYEYYWHHQHHQQQDDNDGDGRDNSHYTPDAFHGHQEPVSRKSSLDTLDTLRADNTTAGKSNRQQSHYGDEYVDADTYYGRSRSEQGSEQPYTFEQYDQGEEFGRSDGQDYYGANDAQFSYHREGISDYEYGAQEQPPASQRQTFEEYQRYAMEQQQYLPPNKGAKGLGRGILDAVGDFLADRMGGLQQQQQQQQQQERPRQNNLGTGQSMASLPPRQSSLRVGRYQQHRHRHQHQHQRQQSQRQMMPQMDTAPLEEPQQVTRQMELMLMELEGDAVPLRGGNRSHYATQKQQLQRPERQMQQHWDSVNSGSRFATSRSGIDSSESSISSLSSRRALRYHDPGWKEEVPEEDYVDPTNGQELICGWERGDDDTYDRFMPGVRSYDVRPPPPQAAHPHYQRNQHHGNGQSQNHSQRYEEEEAEEYQSFQNILPKQHGGLSNNKLVRKTTKQVKFRSPESQSPLLPNGRARSTHFEPLPIPRHQAQDPPDGNGMLSKSRKDPVEQIPARSNVVAKEEKKLQQSLQRNNNSLTSLTNAEINAGDGGDEANGGNDRRVYDLTLEPMLEHLLNFNGSKGSLSSSNDDSGSLNAEQIASIL